MADPNTGNRHLLPLAKAAEMLGLSTDAVEAMVGAGFLLSGGRGPKGPEFSLSDLKAFLARNADNGAGHLFEFGADGSLSATSAAADSIDPQALLDALDGKSDEMARRAFDIFATVFPEATRWSMSEQAKFIEQARGRFEAILAVTGQGAEVDEALVGDLQDVGAGAAWAGSPKIPSSTSRTSPTRSPPRLSFRSQGPKASSSRRVVPSMAGACTPRTGNSNIATTFSGSSSSTPTQIRRFLRVSTRSGWSSNTMAVAWPRAATHCFTWTATRSVKGAWKSRCR